MKHLNLLLALILLISGSTTFAQNPILTMTKISKAEFNKHQPFTNQIDKPLKNLKSKGKIVIKTPVKTITLKDDGDFFQYNHIGSLKGTSLLAIHEIELNSEEYYLINTKTARIDTLLSPPNGYHGNLLCYRLNESDVPQEIQIISLAGNKLKSNAFYKIRDSIVIYKVYWFNYNTLYISTSGNLFYKATLPKQKS